MRLNIAELHHDQNTDINIRFIYLECNIKFISIKEIQVNFHYAKYLDKNKHKIIRRINRNNLVLISYLPNLTHSLPRMNV